MTERKRFQKQNLNSDDYKKIEEGTKLIKTTVKLGAGAFFLGNLIKKYGSEFINGINKLRKI